MKIFYELTTYNKKNKIKIKIKERCRSFVKAFLQIFSYITSDVTINIIDTGGTSRSVSTTNSGAFFIYSGGLDSWSAGIVVGTSNQPVAITDYAMIALIPNGIGTGKLEYYGSYSCNNTVSGSVASFDIEGIFKNSSGGDIIISEVGVYSKGYYSYQYCLIRDVPTPVTISDGEWLKVKYTIQVTA